MPNKKRVRKYDPNFGGHIRKTRKARFPSYSLRKFAAIMRMSAQYLSNIELGSVPPPSVEIVISLANMLEIDQTQLLRMAGYGPISEPYIIRSDFKAPEPSTGTVVIQGSPEGLIGLALAALNIDKNNYTYEQVKFLIREIVCSKKYSEIRAEILDEFEKISE